MRHENGANVAYVDGHVEFMGDKVIRSDLGYKMALEVTQSVSTAFGMD